MHTTKIFWTRPFHIPSPSRRYSCDSPSHTQHIFSISLVSIFVLLFQQRFPHISSINRNAQSPFLFIRRSPVSPHPPESLLFWNIHHPNQPRHLGKTPYVILILTFTSLHSSASVLSLVYNPALSYPPFYFPFPSIPTAPSFPSVFT